LQSKVLARRWRSVVCFVTVAANEYSYSICLVGGTADAHVVSKDFLFIARHEVSKLTEKVSVFLNKFTFQIVPLFRSLMSDDQVIEV
jgi:hypothetical protein